jgi:hypothetical protein
LPLKCEHAILYCAIDQEIDGMERVDEHREKTSKVTQLPFSRARDTDLSGNKESL